MDNTLWSQLVMECFIDCFETMYASLKWSEKVHVVLVLSFDNIYASYDLFRRKFVLLCLVPKNIHCDRNDVVLEFLGRLFEFAGFCDMAWVCACGFSSLEYITRINEEFSEPFSYFYGNGFYPGDLTPYYEVFILKTRWPLGRLAKRIFRNFLKIRLQN